MQQCELCPHLTHLEILEFTFLDAPASRMDKEMHTDKHTTELWACPKQGQAVGSATTRDI